MNFEAALIAVLIVTGLMALFVLPAVRGAMVRTLKTRRFKQSGNVFFMLFGAVAIAGLIGVSTMTTMKGPTRGITHSNQVAAANNTLYTTARMIAGAVQADADCDSDGIVEPPPWRNAGGLSAPSGGGLVPTDLGATQRDPWGSDIGYCAWDHGRRTVTHDVATCGGAGVNRLVGVDSKSEYVIAVISAGPDRTFQTTCNLWVDADDDGVPDAPLIVTPSGSDDIVRAETITALFAEGSTNQLQQLPDDACTPDAIGTLRYDAGTMQVCRDTGWQEVGSAIQVSGSFLPVTGAQLGSEHTTSNGISFTGFFGTRTASVDGGAALIVNGVEQGNTASIVAGDTIELKANAAGAPATTSTFTLSVSTLRRAWTITTRDPTPPALVMTPASNSAMNVTGPGSPAHGTTVRFTVRNSGETPTVALGAAQLSNTTNFVFDASGANVGDACQGQVLAHNATCFIDVRPRSSTPGSFSGTLSTAAGSVSADSALSGMATGWPCTVTAGTTWAVSGKTCTAPSVLNINHGATATSTDSTQPTTGSATYSCNNGTTSLTSSSCTESCAANQTVNWAPGCSAPSGALLANGANRTITNTASGYTGTRVITCNNGTLAQSGGGCATEQVAIASLVYTTTGNIIMNYPSGISAGDVLVFSAVTEGNGASIGVPPGFTDLGGGVNTGGTDTIWRYAYKIASGSESGSITITKHSSYHGVSQITAVKGVTSLVSNAQSKYTGTGPTPWLTSSSGSQRVYVYVVQPRPRGTQDSDPSNPVGFDEVYEVNTPSSEQSVGVRIEPAGSGSNTMSWTLPVRDGHYYRFILQ